MSRFLATATLCLFSQVLISTAFKIADHVACRLPSRYYSQSASQSLTDDVTSSTLAFHLHLDFKSFNRQQLSSNFNCDRFFVHTQHRLRNTAFPRFAALQMLADTQILDPQLPGPVKRRHRGFGSADSQAPTEPKSISTTTALTKPDNKGSRKATQKQAADMYRWDGLDAVPAPSVDEDEDDGEEESTVSSESDALASVRSEPRKPSGARWRSRAADETAPVAPVKVRRAAAAAAPLPSTSRRGNHDFAVAELLRKTTSLVRGKPGAATMISRVSQSSDLYTNPGTLPCKSRCLSMLV